MSILLFRTTLDIDFTSKWSRLKPKDKEFIKKIIDKISECPFLFQLKFRLSSSKGCHIELFCNKNCDICRLCYDDDRRFSYDQNRPEWARNILFDAIEDIEE